MLMKLEKNMNRKAKNIFIYLNYWRTAPAYLLVRGGRFRDRYEQDISEFDLHLYGGTLTYLHLVES